MTLVNIAKDDTKPLFVDPSKITAIQVLNADATGNELAVILYNDKDRFLTGSLKDLNLDVADMVKKLTDNGAQLLPLTMHSEGKEYPNFIAPKAVTFATISQPEKDGKAGAIIGVKGAGRIETWDGAAQTEIDNLIQAVRNAKPLFEYNPEIAYARWGSPAKLYIDPASVTRM